jgi:hypothetical protein
MVDLLTLGSLIGNVSAAQDYPQARKRRPKTNVLRHALGMPVSFAAARSTLPSTANSGPQGRLRTWRRRQR